MQKLRVGIIGAGQIVETAHIPAYIKHRDIVELTAICDINEEKARHMADKYGIAAYYKDYQDMLKECKLDAVSVCVINRFHAQAAVDALNAGCHVLCEKPPAMNYEEALAMYEASKKNKKILTFNFHFRHAQEIKILKELIDKGMFGNIYAARVQALRRRGIPGWGNFINKEVQGGGPLIDIGIHMLDAALYLMGFPEPDYVAAGAHQRIGNRSGVGLMGSWDPAKFTVEDSLFGFIRFKNGATLNLETSFALNMKEESIMNVHIFGEKAGASAFPLEVFSETDTALTNMEFPYLQEIDKRYESIADFINSCVYGKKPLYKAEESLIIQKIIDIMYKSSETSQPLKW
ncbi:Gfo/Idh/MocA family protein [Tepidanaerobacter syntrophicus]|uniref:Dehydrogenase n=1 Tax=Tepidanaerobacter syntrophicus TaxID=224999 RepID=A0A0U9HKW0_9FIRM|nr:Gfo/Idh/MocA family oxidoreductase [Tepidanaerobacter syntrophicus]GAQ24947.1 dehydrogenase [Tepidanaerobacter syntrophicus]